LLFELSKKAVKVFQTILFFPYFISWVVVGYVTYILLNPSYGVINSILKTLHFAPINWYLTPKLWPFILVLVFLWKNVGYFVIIFYTGLLGIDSSYYEAAAIDGATKFQQTIKITIPLLAPLIIMIMLLQIGKIMYADFGLFYFIPRDIGSLYSAVDVIDTYVFRSLRVTGDIGMASAAGLYQSVVGCILVFLSNKIVKKYSEENALF
jgi:putative aldouronate transport system permease protein